MANPKDRFSDNARGPWYIDSQCIDCDLCQNIAPSVFGRNAAEGHAIVIQQPKSAEDKIVAQEALEHCPVEAIGDNA